MALSPSEEALVRGLIAQNAALLSLASSEPTILSKLGATKATLSDLPVASSLADTDLFLVRQGTTDRSVQRSVVNTGLVKLSDFSQTLAANGRQQLPSGLMLQWGSLSISGSGARTQNITLPVAFSTNTLRTWATDVGAACATVASAPLSASQIQVFIPSGQIGTSTTVSPTGTVTVQWFALGF